MQGEDSHLIREMHLKARNDKGGEPTLEAGREEGFSHSAIGENTDTLILDF